MIGVDVGGAPTETSPVSVWRFGRFAALRGENFQIWRDAFEGVGIQNAHDILVDDRVGDGRFGTTVWHERLPAFVNHVLLIL